MGNRNIIRDKRLRLLIPSRWTYKLLEKRGNVKIKVYAPMVVAKSIIEGNYDSALKKDFTGIVNYIFNKKLSNNKGVKNE